MLLKNHKESILFISDSKCSREKFPEGQQKADVIQARKFQDEGNNIY